MTDRSAAGIRVLAIAIAAFAAASDARAASAEVIAKALRLSSVITGGTMPTGSAEFLSMVSAIEGPAGIAGAAKIAISSRYGVGHLMRRIAFQMQNPTGDATSVDDNDATAFIIAHLAGAATLGPPSISKLWSDDVTCSVNIMRGQNAMKVKAADLRDNEKLSVDWKTALDCTAGQRARSPVDGSSVVIPAQHVGGYLTLSDRRLDGSIAEYGATAGTNLRYIYSIWQTATGLGLMDFASSRVPAQVVPRFVPANDPNFLMGQGQNSCISCHGGGLVSVNHGYATVADLFNHTRDGFFFDESPEVNQRKSLGSSAGNRQRTLECNFVTFTTCNPDSAGVAADHGWDVSDWAGRGLLARMGWNGPSSGKGLNSLGAALGKATIVYSNLTKRVIREICPLGAIKNDEVEKIAEAAQKTDDFSQIVVEVATHPACL